MKLTTIYTTTAHKLLTLFKTNKLVTSVVFTPEASRDQFRITLNDLLTYGQSFDALFDAVMDIDCDVDVRDGDDDTIIVSYRK